jgi:ACS family hexuronate transporter-like MFS transporter
MNAGPATRSSWWKWWVCGLLLGAALINYMDRQTLANAAVRITREFHLNEEQYGNLEQAFGLAFGFGALLWGYVADRVSVRWLYPAILVAWSCMGVLTSFMQSYEGLLVCRTLLGVFESGHWPCALKTTQRLLVPADRTMGNSVLQSGVSIGAIVTPLLMNAILNAAPGGALAGVMNGMGVPENGRWRFAFAVVGALGFFWVAVWLSLVKKGALDASPNAFDSPVSTESKLGFLHALLNRRALACVAMVVTINICWQIIRAWLTKFLVQGRGYAESDALWINAAYFGATDIGCLAAGAVSLWLARRGLSVHRSRTLVFFACCCLTALTTLVPALPKGALLLGVLMLVGFGALGVFPCYYSFTQEISMEHQGKLTGVFSFCTWTTSAPLQKLFGRLVDQTGSFDLGLMVVGWAPMIGFLALWLLWPKEAQTAKPAPTAL